MNSWDRFDKTEFPPKDEFYSTLNGTDVNNDDYEFGKLVFTETCSTMGDYHDLYLFLDALL
jgi:hypothetical protein